MKKASFEQADNAGTTKQYRAAISSATTLPASPDKFIDEFIVQNCDTTNDLKVQIGAETDFFTVKKCGGNLVWTPKGDVKQITITPAAGTVTHETIINFSDC